MKKQPSYFLFVCIGCVFVCSYFSQCANIRPPQGGPKDTLAPKLTYSNPKHKQTNVTNREITLIFDDIITADNLESELIVTPVMAKKYTVKSTNHSVKIKFNEPLKDSTTYTLTFRKGITDITENLPAKNLTLVFTTGDKLDSFAIHGNVKKLITKTLQPNAVIACYRTDKDTITDKTIPLYQTLSDEAGFFSIENIKDDNYLIYSYSDANKDYKYDPATELLSKHFFVKGTTALLDFNLFLQNTKRNRASETEQKGKTILTQFTTPFSSAQLTSLKDSLKFYHKISSNKLEIWPHVKADTTADTLRVQILVSDSASIFSTDTISFKYKYSLTSHLLITSFYQEKTNQTNKLLYTIETNIPLGTIRGDEIEIKVDKRKYSLTETNYSLNANKTKIQFFLPSVAKDSIKIKIVPQALTSIYNDTNTFYTRTLLLADEETKGILSGTVKSSFPNYILQILEANYAVKESFININEFKIKNLDPATYTLRLIEDRNANGKWDFVVDGKIDPEKIIYYKEKIIMKANWEINDVLISD